MTSLPCTFSDLRRKEVINICTGCRIGCICDAELDIACGRILALIVSEHPRIFSFKHPDEYRVPWDCINKIGDDIILVNGAYPINQDNSMC